MVKIAVIVAHPDDAEIWVGGTLLNHIDNGDVIRFWYPQCRDAVRQGEASRGALALNAQALFPNDDAELLRDLVHFRPDVIITQWELDSHPDHRRASVTVREIFPPLAIEFGIWPRLYACDTYNSLGGEPGQIFEPTDIIDITSVWERKLKLFQSYSSQPMRYFAEMAERQARLHGAQTGVEFAEAFRQVPMLGIQPRHRRLILVR